MHFDLRATVRGAMDVVVPPLAFERVRERAATRLRTGERRRARSMLSAAALVAVLAMFVAGHGSPVVRSPGIAALPIPAPAPLAT